MKAVHPLLLLFFIGICIALANCEAWDQRNLWVGLLGVVCVVIGIGIERIAFRHVKTVTKNEDELFRLPVQARGSIMEAGCLSMLLAAGYFLLGLILLGIQVKAFVM